MFLDNGKELRREHVEREVLCLCNDDDSGPVCGENCKKVLKAARETVTGVLIFVVVCITSPLMS